MTALKMLDDAIKIQKDEKRKKSVEYHDNELNVLQCQYKGNKAFSFKHLK